MQLGPLVDGLRVVRTGVADGDLVVVNGLQRVRPGAVVNRWSCRWTACDADGRRGHGPERK